MSVLLAFSACSTYTEKIKIKPGPIFLDADTLRPKQNFTIYYNTHAEGAVFKGKENLILYLDCFNDDLMLTYKLSFENLQQDTNVYFCNFTIPDDIDCMSATIRNNSTAFTWIHKNFSVFPQHKQASHFSLIQQLQTETNSERVNSVFALDTLYYPNYFNRDLLYWLYLDNNANKKEEIDSAEIKYNQICNSISFDEKMNDLLCLATGNIEMQNYDKALKLLNQINDSLKVTKSTITNRALFCNNLNICLANIFKHYSSKLNNFVKTFLEISLEIKDIKVSSFFIMQLNFHPEFLTQYKNEFQQSLKNATNDLLLLNTGKPERYLLSGLSFYSMFHKLSLSLGDTVNSKIILSKIDNLLRQYNYPHISKDTNDYIPDTDGSNGVLSALLYDEGKFYFNINNYSMAEPYLVQVINQFTPDKATIGPISLSEILLTKINIKKERLDSAEYYLFKAVQSNSPFAMQTFSMLNKEKNKLGIDTTDFGSYLKNSKIQYGDNYEPLPSTVITTDKDVFSTGMLNDSIVFMFYIVDACAYCNIGVLNSLDILTTMQLTTPYKVLIVSDNRSPKELRSIFGKDISIVSRSKCPIQPKDAKNKEKASFAIIKGNRILKSETIPQTKEYFYEILNK